MQIFATNIFVFYNCVDIGSFYRTQVNLGSDSWVRMSLSNVCADLTDVTLADEDTNSILINNAKRAIQDNEAMQAMQTSDQCKFASIGSALPVDQICSQFKWCQVMVKLGVEQILAILAEFTGISFLNRRQTLQLFL